MRADTLFDEILEIADSVQIGETITTKAGEQEITQADRFQHRRLRIDARKSGLSIYCLRSMGTVHRCNNPNKRKRISPLRLKG